MPINHSQSQMSVKIFGTAESMVVVYDISKFTRHHSHLIYGVGRAGSDKWKLKSAAEKAPYVAKADKMKSIYDKSLQPSNKISNDAEDTEEESDKSKSEVHEDEEDDDTGGQAHFRRHQVRT